MNKIIDFFKNDHIQVALGTGACILILSFFFKKVMQTQISGLESALLGLALAVFEAVRAKKGSVDRFWVKPWFWNLTMLAIVGLVIVRRLYFI